MKPTKWKCARCNKSVRVWTTPKGELLSAGHKKTNGQWCNNGYIQIRVEDLGGEEA